MEFTIQKEPVKGAVRASIFANATQKKTPEQMRQLPPQVTTIKPATTFQPEKFLLKHQVNMNDYLNIKLEQQKQQEREQQKPCMSLSEKVQTLLQVDEEQILLDELVKTKKLISECQVSQKKVKVCIPCGRLFHRDYFKRHLTAKSHNSVLQKLRFCRDVLLL